MADTVIGTEIQNYRILQKLGEGGMGVVYKAVDTSLDRVVAIKALNAELAGNPELEQRFRNEAKAQANLNHPNLATIFAFFVNGGRPWMVLEFIEGETLEQTIFRRGPIPSQESVPLFRQALLGLGYAHRMGIVHRDIKPSNLMVNQQGTVKVMDFGIAKVMGSRGMTRTGTHMGTAFYMSPEQVLNRGVDIRSDVYSLGITLYELLSGRVPFESDSDYEIMTAHVNTPPPLPSRFYPYIPKGIENAVLKAVAKNPDDRFQTVEEFGSALEHPDDFVAAPVAARGVTVLETPATVVGAAAMAGVAAGAAAGAVPAGTMPGAGITPPTAPTNARPPGLKLPAWNQQTKIVAAGLATVFVLCGGWLALRPKPVVQPLSMAGTSGSLTSPVPESKTQIMSTPTQPATTPPASTPPATGDAKTGGDAAAAPPQQEAPAAEAPAAQILIPAGAEVKVRVNDAIDSRASHIGDHVNATVIAPVVVGGNIIVPFGSPARLQLTNVANAGHIEGRSLLQLQLVSLTIHGRGYAVHSAPFVKAGSSRGKRSAEVIGGAAAVGAVIGGIFHHKKGAAEGAAAGAGVGSAAQFATKGDFVRIDPETKITFTLRSPVVT